MIGNEFINNNNEEIVRDQHLASDRFLWQDASTD